MEKIQIRVDENVKGNLSDVEVQEMGSYKILESYKKLEKEEVERVIASVKHAHKDDKVEVLLMKY